MNPVSFARQQQLAAARPHLQYRCWMLRHCGKRYGDEEDWVIAHALLESFLIHARALFVFLEPPIEHMPPRWEGDIFARDYLGDEADWSAEDLELAAAFARDFLMPLDPHVTRFSPSQPKPEWPFEAELQFIRRRLQGLLLVMPELFDKPTS